MYQKIFQQITQQANTTVITANQRLSSYLLQNYYALKNTHTVQKPDILPLSAWLERTYNDYLDRGWIDTLLLNALQEDWIWQNIINQTTDLALLRVDATSKLVKQAWHLLQQWRVKIEPNLFQQTIDTKLFHNWTQQFTEYCNNNNYCSNINLIEILIPHFKKYFQSVSNLLFVGFLEITPNLQYLIKCLNQAGCQYEIIEPKTHTATVKSIAFNNSEAELQHMATWAYNIARTDPQANIVCIAPDLTQQRNKISACFATVLTKQFNYNISGGQTLNEFAMIEHAMQLLRLSWTSLPFLKLSQLLRSVYLGEATTECFARIQLDLYLREQQQCHINLTTLIQLTQQWQQQHSCSHLVERLKQLQQLIQQQSSMQLPSTWANCFYQLLQCIAWPGERNLNSLEYQLLQRWQQLLHEFSSLDWVAGKLNIAQAWQALNQVTHTTIFQAKSNAANIQVLGVLEASGSYFDHIWLMNCHDQAWPAAANPNPFLPLQLQCKQQMPHANAERELHFSQLLTNSFINNAKTVCFSYPTHAEERTLLPSPLIKSYPKTTIENLNCAITATPAQQLLGTAILENIADPKGPSINKNELTSGGSNIFKLQATCPFRAFAEQRLCATPLPIPKAALSALERGISVHKILQNLWGKLNSQQQLYAMSKHKLTTMVTNEITLYLQTLQQRYPKLLAPQFLILEHKRLQNLILNWLELEKQRQEFTVIATELEKTISIAGLNCKLKIDRVDRLADSTEVIIDYKTGLSNINTWFGEYLAEPQLPLYAVTHNTTISALVFAQIRVDDCKFIGITQQDDSIPNCKSISAMNNYTQATTWQQQLASWKTQLQQLAQEFMQGHAIVAPAQAQQSCNTCQLHMLCRINQGSKDG